MRRPAILLALLLLLPTASAVGILPEITPEAARVTVAAVAPALLHPGERETPEPPAGAAPAGPTPAAPSERRHPEAAEAAATIEVPEEVPVSLRRIMVEVEDGRGDESPLGAKLERVETQAAHDGRVPTALPPARLPMLPPLARLPVPDPAPRVGAPEPEVPDRAPETRTASEDEPTPAEPERTTIHWGTAAVTAMGIAIALLAPFLLYHRLRGAQTLEHAPRARLLALVHERPGLTPSIAARALGIDPTTALYHLRRLVKEGIVVAEGPPRGARYFAVGTHNAEARARLVAVQSAGPVLDAVKSAPGATKGELAQRLAIARASLSWHLARLERAGLVRSEREGRVVRLFPKEALS